MKNSVISFQDLVYKSKVFAMCESKFHIWENYDSGVKGQNTLGQSDWLSDCKVVRSQEQVNELTCI